MNMAEQLGKILIAFGIGLVLAGLFLIFGRNIPLGRLPGDITIQKENFTFYFPVVTSILISIFITVLLFFIGKR